MIRDYHETDLLIPHLGQPLASGASGAVYRGRLLGRFDVVVKVPTPGSVEAADALDKEIQVLAKLNNHNVVKLYGTTKLTIKGTAIRSAVMEYCSRGSLTQVLGDQTIVLDLPRRYTLCAGIANGLAHLHKKGYVHKDLKSLNIFITEDFQAKLGDYGSSTASIRSATLELNVLQGMTLQWMPPESFGGRDLLPVAGNRNYFSKAGDVYAMAIVFWEIFAREIPWKGKGIVELSTIVMSVDPEVNRPKLGEAWPQLAKTIITRCWEGNRRLRPRAEDVYVVANEAAQNPSYPVSGALHQLSPGARHLDDGKNIISAMRQNLRGVMKGGKVDPDRCAAFIETTKARVGTYLKEGEPQTNRRIRTFFEDVHRFIEAHGLTSHSGFSSLHKKIVNLFSNKTIHFEKTLAVLREVRTELKTIQDKVWPEIVGRWKKKMHDRVISLLVPQKQLSNSVSPPTDKYQVELIERVKTLLASDLVSVPNWMTLFQEVCREVNLLSPTDSDKKLKALGEAIQLLQARDPLEIRNQKFDQWLAVVEAFHKGIKKRSSGSNLSPQEWVQIYKDLKYEEASQAFRMAIRRGRLDGYYHRALALQHLGRDKESVELLKRGANFGDGSSCIELAEMHRSNHSEMTKWLKIGADHGSQEAAYLYGKACYNGTHGLQVDWALAATYLKKAADLGNIRSCRLYALICYHKRLPEALVYFTRAANQRDYESAFCLARIYDMGFRDRTKALELYRQLALLLGKPGAQEMSLEQVREVAIWEMRKFAFHVMEEKVSAPVKDVNVDAPLSNHKED